MTAAGNGKTVILVDHPVGQRDDRASRLLAARGYETKWVRVAAGEKPPAPSAAYAGAIVYGGPESVNDLTAYPYLKDEMDWIEDWIAAERPFLGICLGAQLLARVLGAPVSRHPEGLHEIGYVEIEPTSRCGFLSAPLSVYHWHNEGFEVPQSAQRLAAGPVFPNQAFRYGGKAYGIQFHPEVCARVMQRWLTDASPMLAEPGAQSAADQRAGNKRHDKAMAAWLDGFLDRWLEPAAAGKARA
ncbi:MAG TPA: GMP synthase [Kiloniellaceae bacterium]|nr:GMP synthase [Kiloniellaceae bacterium]